MGVLYARLAVELEALTATTRWVDDVVACQTNEVRLNLSRSSVDGQSEIHVNLRENGCSGSGCLDVSLSDSEAFGEHFNKL